MELEVVCHHPCQLGEGPIWDARRNAVCWIDIIRGEIHQYTFEDNSLRTYPVHEMVGCIALCKNGDFILASKSGIALMNRTTAEITRLADPENHLPNNRFNDGKCDPAGRFWAGTMSLTEAPGAGSLYCFTPETIVKKIENVTISNGLAWSSDHQTLYYIDTPAYEVVAYRYEKSTGLISDRKVVIKIPEDAGAPDGMTIDKDGMLWIAHWGGWQVTRWNPDTGEQLHHIKLPVARVSCCTFGGEHYRDLFITTAREGLTEEELNAQPLAGSLFVIRNCGFEGLPPFEYNN